MKKLIRADFNLRIDLLKSALYSDVKSKFNCLNILCCRRYILALFVITILSALAFADLDADITAVGKEMVGQEVPGSLGKFLGNDNINVYIKMASGEDKILGISFQDKKINKFEMGELTSPSLKVYLSEEALNEIFYSQTPIATMNRVMKEGKATYEAIGFKNKLKFGMAVLFLKMFGEKEIAGEGKAEEKKTEPEAKVKEKKKEETKPAESKTEEKKEEVKEEKAEEKKEETKPETNTTTEAQITSTTHTIEVKKEGFVPAELTIKVGDTVEWKVTRAGYLHSAMILGTQNCVSVKSKILNTGDSFKWTFDKAGTCTIVDGITTTQIGKITVEN